MPMLEESRKSSTNMRDAWSDSATVHLIEVYEDKWFSLKRGNLKSKHWEEVAFKVSMRCTGEPIKNWQKCKNKMEKLKKRYRAEKILGQNSGCPSRWWFYKRMEDMVLGTQKCEGNADAAHGNNDPLNEVDNHVQKLLEGVPGAGKRVEDEHRRSEAHPRSEEFQRCQENCDVSYTSNEDEDEIPDEDTPAPGYDACKRNFVSGTSSLNSCRNLHCGMIQEMTSVMRSFAEGFLKLEEAKLELQRDKERVRAETELKRTQMLIASQKQIARLFVKAINNKKKAKRPRLADAQEAADTD